MKDIVYIKFEKLTGLKGSIEGTFVCKDCPIQNGVVVLQHSNLEFMLFSQEQETMFLKFLGSDSLETRVDYLNHFRSGVNFLITEFSNGRGVGTTGKDIN